jgi:Pretoxin HINT domain
VAPSTTVAAIPDVTANVAGDEASGAAAGGAGQDGGGQGGDSADTDDPEDSCGGESFTAGTLVLLASGKMAPISSLEKGEKVEAADTKTGKNQAETVTAVLLHHDTDLYNLTVRSGGRTEVIHTTSNHLFWDPYPHYGWIPSNHLKPGMHLKTPDGKSAVVVSGSVPAVHDGWMWDLTVQDDHDFYVEPAVVLPPSRAGPSDVAVLVHNCGEYNNFYGGSEGGVMATLDKDGVLSLAIEKGPTTPNGGQMFTDAVNNFGADNINGIAGKWVRAMPSNLNTFNDLVRSGMSPEEAAASTFTGKMAARFGFTDVSITSLSGEPGAYTDVQALFTRPAG